MPRAVSTLRWCLLLAVAGAPAQAHDADVVFARLEPDESGPGLVEVVTLTTTTLVQLAPVDVDGDGLVTQTELDARATSIIAGVWNDMPLSVGGARCARDGEQALVDEGFIRLTARFRCPDGTLRQDFKVLRILPPNYRVVLGSQLDGERGRRFAQGVFTVLEVPRPSPASVSRWTPTLNGLRAMSVVEALALILLVLIAAPGGAAAGARSAVLLAGTLVVFCGRPSFLGAAVLMLAGCSAAIPLRREWPALVACALGGAGLALRASVRSPEDGAGWLLGAALVVGLATVVALPLGRLLRRQPRALRVVRLGLAVVVLCAVGARMGGALA